MTCARAEPIRRFRQLPGKQPGNVDQQIANPARARERETHRWLETERPADHDEAPFLHAESAGHKKRRAAHGLDERFDHHRFDQTDLRSEKRQDEPEARPAAGATYCSPPG